MDPSRKRKIRLAVALGAAVCLAAALLYTSFSASSEAAKPSELREGQSYEVTGKVVHGSITRSGDELRFRIRDRDGTRSVPVTYTGSVPDPFRDGRDRGCGSAARHPSATRWSPSARPSSRRT